MRCIPIQTFHPIPLSVFLHGIGVGLLPYLPLLRRLSRAFPRHPILTLEMPWVALRVCRVPTPDEVAERIGEGWLVEGV